MNKELIKKSYFFNFLKKLKKFVSYKFNPERIYRKYFSFYRIYLFYLKIVPLEIRINILKGEDIKFLLKEDLKKFYKIKCIPELSHFFIKQAKKGVDIEENLIKASWCISFNQDKKYNLEYLVNEIDSLEINFRNYYSLFYTLTVPFFYRGAYFRAEKLEKELQLIFDKKNKRSLSIINENQHFTAIGHLVLIFFLIKAVESKLIDTSQTPISLIYDPDKIANTQYAILIAELCPKYGINIINSSSIKPNQYQPNLELWPSFSKNEYLISRRYYGFAYNEAKKNNPNFYLKPKDIHLEVAEKIIKRFSLSINKWFVGMQVRYAKDGEELKNPSPLIFQKSIDFINKNGGTVLLIGLKNNKIYNSFNSIIDTTKLPIDQFERECLSIYIWAKSKFFIGCLSGGSLPSMTFGVRTLWLDIHPTELFRTPNVDDICLPKRIFYEPENRYLSFKEANQKQHYISQTENPELAKKHGYRIESVSFDLVEEILQNLISGEQNISPLYNQENHPSISIGSKIYTKKL